MKICLDKWVHYSIDSDKTRIKWLVEANGEAKNSLNNLNQHRENILAKLENQKELFDAEHKKYKENKKNYSAARTEIINQLKTTKHKLSASITKFNTLKSDLTRIYENLNATPQPKCDDFYALMKDLTQEETSINKYSAEITNLNQEQKQQGDKLLDLQKGLEEMTQDIETLNGSAKTLKQSISAFYQISNELHIEITSAECKILTIKLNQCEYASKILNTEEEGNIKTMRVRIEAMKNKDNNKIYSFKEKEGREQITKLQNEVTALETALITQYKKLDSKFNKTFANNKDTHQWLKEFIKQEDALNGIVQVVGSNTYQVVGKQSYSDGIITQVNKIIKNLNDEGSWNKETIMGYKHLYDIHQIHTNKTTNSLDDYSTHYTVLPHTHNAAANLRMQKNVSEHLLSEHGNAERVINQVYLAIQFREECNPAFQKDLADLSTLFSQAIKPEQKIKGELEKELKFQEDLNNLSSYSQAIKLEPKIKGELEKLEELEELVKGFSDKSDDYLVKLMQKKTDYDISKLVIDANVNQPQIIVDIMSVIKENIKLYCDISTIVEQNEEVTWASTTFTLCK